MLGARASRQTDHYVKRSHRCKSYGGHCRNSVSPGLNQMGIRSRIKRKMLGLVFDSITDSFERYVEQNPGCRLCEASAAVLPSNYGKRSRLFASHVMDDLVKADKVHKHKGERFPRFYHQRFLA